MQPFVDQLVKEAFAALSPDWSKHLEISCSS
jgi:uncharacterized protein YdiU (UPF0061 family)